MHGMINGKLFFNLSEICILFISSYFLHHLVHITLPLLILQGFSYLSEVGARGLLNLAKKAFGSSKLGKFDAV